MKFYFGQNQHYARLEIRILRPVVLTLLRRGFLLRDLRLATQVALKPGQVPLPLGFAVLVLGQPVSLARVNYKFDGHF